MPIYEYICLDCESEFELLRPMSQADQPTPCPSCSHTNAKRKLSVFFAESGGKAVAGTSEPGCAGCSSGNCAGCGH